MASLQFHPGPKLMFRTYPMSEWREVTDAANSFLFEEVELLEGVTVGDVLQLLTRAPDLATAFKLRFSGEITRELHRVLSTGPSPSKTLEYVEVFRIGSFNSHSKVGRGIESLQAEGRGPVLHEAAPDCGAEKGERLRYGISLTPLGELLPLPIRFNPEVTVQEGDIASTSHMQEICRILLPELTLGQLLTALMSAISFHGGPESRQEFKEELERRGMELERGGVQGISLSQYLDSRYGPACQQVFHSMGSASPSELWAAIRAVPDAALIAEALTDAFSGAVRLRAEYLGLPAIEFRRQFLSLRGKALRAAVSKLALT